MCTAIVMRVKSKEGKFVEAERDGLTLGRIMCLMASVEPGDHVLVHVGYVTEKIYPAEAEKTLSSIREIIENTREYRKNIPAPPDLSVS